MLGQKQKRLPWRRQAKRTAKIIFCYFLGLIAIVMGMSIFPELQFHFGFHREVWVQIQASLGIMSFMVFIVFLLTLTSLLFRKDKFN